MIGLITRSWEETENFGAYVGKNIKENAPVILALTGELASGKTCFVKGLVREICGDWWVHSPTFTIINMYGTSPKVIHIDCYRITSYKELISIGVEEVIGSDCICVIEWADKVKEILPPEYISIHFEHIDETTRKILVSDPSSRLEQVVKNYLPPRSIHQTGQP